MWFQYACGRHSWRLPGADLPDLSIREESPIRAAAAQWRWDDGATGIRSHSEQVARICMELFDQLQTIQMAQLRCPRVIEYAAFCHDIGWHIAPQGESKHRMYFDSDTET